MGALEAALAQQVELVAVGSTKEVGVTLALAVSLLLERFEFSCVLHNIQVALHIGFDDALVEQVVPEGSRCLQLLRHVLSLGV